MKNKWISGAILLTAFTAQAQYKHKISLDSQQLTTHQIEKSNTQFVQLHFKNIIDTDRTIGAPELPTQTWLIKGSPKNIKVQFRKYQQLEIAGRPTPVQKQDCRCETSEVKVFDYRTDLYENVSPAIKIQHLGSFRGQDISQVSVRLADYIAELDQIKLTTQGEVEINSPEFSLNQSNLKDYLIITTPQLADGVSDFANWKRQNGYTVNIETVASPNNTTTSVQALVKQYYTQKGVDFVMIVGDESTIPMFRVHTSASSQTPSDLKYYTMDGDQDYVPDVLASRLVANSSAQVAEQLAKSIEFEQRSYDDASGLNKFVGIASNEGANPSDDEYVKAIGAKYKEVLNSEILHLAQNDAALSNPAVLNSNLNTGASWLTYLGHGSGTSWPSFNQTYTTANIAQLNNKSVVKPIIIDVACQNGRLIPANIGSQFMKVSHLQSGHPHGAVAYYGGSVNISWHPPAVMAQGIAFEHLAKKYNHLGEALLAGQLYLAGKWANKADVVDNFEWYHLQGDPSLNVAF